MKKLFLILIMFPWFIAAQSTDIYGTWVSFAESELLYMKEDNTFLRKSDSETAVGTFELTDKHINVTKENEKYSLAYILKGTSLYVYKPKRKEIWIFEKVRN